MSFEVLVEQVHTLEKKLEAAEERLDNLKSTANPTYKEVFFAKREVKNISKSLIKVQGRLDQAHLNKEKGGMNY